MKHREICPGVWELSAGIVKVYLISRKEELTLIDTGLPGWSEKILESIDSLGLDRSHLKHILITHFHNDHIGSLEKLKEITGATVYAHRNEAATIGTFQHAVSTPGLLHRLVFNLMIKGSMGKPQPWLPVDEVFDGGEVLDFAGGLKVISTPGHTKGHTSYLLPRNGGILFVGDAASGGNKPGYPMLFSDEKEALKTMALLGSLDYETACFSHGKTIVKNAPALFRQAFHRQVF